LNSATKQWAEAIRERDTASKERDAAKRQEAQAKKDLQEQMEVQEHITIVENVVMRERVATQQGKCSQCLRIICACKPAAQGNPDDAKFSSNPQATSRSELLQAQKERDAANEKARTLNAEVWDLRRTMEDLKIQGTNHELRNREMKDRVRKLFCHLQSICTEVGAELKALDRVFAETRARDADMMHRSNVREARIYHSDLHVAGAPPTKRARSADAWRHSVNRKSAARGQKLLSDEERKKFEEQQEQITKLETDVLSSRRQQYAARGVLLGFVASLNVAQVLVREAQLQQQTLSKEHTALQEHHMQLQKDKETSELESSRVALQLAQTKSEAAISAAAAAKAIAAETAAVARCSVLDESVNDQRCAWHLHAIVGVVVCVGRCMPEVSCARAKYILVIRRNRRVSQGSMHLQVGQIWTRWYSE